MRWIAASKAAVVCLGLLAVAACSNKNNPANPSAGGMEQAVPGSERDFTLNVGDRIFFPNDVTQLSAENMDTLRRQAQWLKQYPGVTVQVEGHADERGTREYNLALSARRAANAKQFLLAQGIAPNRVSTISYGKERPVALCDAESCWAQNRRAVTVIMSGAVSG
ncbi:peptidoglycan-associated lipoprotein Pal [Rhodoligotrophos appendicifer]|uniref:peptidoglycan-associated lipoprotein Pal n=1 Tax=Rhodoligotrophos appendicifer TaxID=987056 RepID=UPI00118676DA|nr:peptidoglycan-associated lipoprotein Pal [Rhodoligotrophos appendicifer]